MFFLILSAETDKEVLDRKYLSGAELVRTERNLSHFGILQSIPFYNFTDYLFPFFPAYLGTVTNKEELIKKYNSALIVYILGKRQDKMDHFNLIKSCNTGELYAYVKANLLKYFLITEQDLDQHPEFVLMIKKKIIEYKNPSENDNYFNYDRDRKVRLLEAYYYSNDIEIYKVVSEEKDQNGVPLVEYRIYMKRDREKSSMAFLASIKTENPLKFQLNPSLNEISVLSSDKDIIFEKAVEDQNYFYIFTQYKDDVKTLIRKLNKKTLKIDKSKEIAIFPNGLSANSYHDNCNQTEDYPIYCFDDSLYIHTEQLTVLSKDLDHISRRNKPIIRVYKKTNQEKFIKPYLLNYDYSLAVYSDNNYTYFYDFKQQKCIQNFQDNWENSQLYFMGKSNKMLDIFNDEGYQEIRFINIDSTNQDYQPFGDNILDYEYFINEFGFAGYAFDNSNVYSILIYYANGKNKSIPLNIQNRQTVQKQFNQDYFVRVTYDEFEKYQFSHYQFENKKSDSVDLPEKDKPITILCLDHHGQVLLQYKDRFEKYRYFLYDNKNGELK